MSISACVSEISGTSDGDRPPAERPPVSQDEGADIGGYRVVVNDEEQYSLWPARRDNAPGWRDTGKAGTKAECLAWVEETWTDMRPLSLRRHIDQQQ